MKAKIIGAVILAGVIAAAAAYAGISRSSAVTEISGSVGGEKIGLLEDEEVQDILKKDYKLKINYSKAGSIDMVTSDPSGKDYLFPSNQTALELFKENNGKPVRSEIIFNTPIVLYTRKAVADALTDQGMVSTLDGVSYIDMQKLTQTIEDGKSWSDIGLPQLYGNVTVGTTDPTKSNSGNMFACLLACTLGGGAVNENNVDDVLPELKTIYQRLGYMESSSSDLFDQFLKTGMGAKPLIAGYESQILEFAAENPDTWSQISDDIVMLYPTPTVWASHVFIALDDKASAAIDALKDKKIQQIAWERHGFRTNVYDALTDGDHFGVDGVADNINQVAPMPDAATMNKILEALGE